MDWRRAVARDAVSVPDLTDPGPRWGYLDLWRASVNASGVKDAPRQGGDGNGNVAPGSGTAAAGP
ncbi:hypothetical protein AZA_35383 [Nitrospirillum viridazoti Y2]|nr:hypothetical protein AZA_35383 [Nitrospirillum amazonense Y2]